MRAHDDDASFDATVITVCAHTLTIEVSRDRHHNMRADADNTSYDVALITTSVQPLTT